MRSSVAVRTGFTSPKPRSASSASSSWTSTSGTEAPEVTPTLSTPSNHSSRSSETLSMRWEDFAPASSATSIRRTEFEEFGEPTTRTRSASGAIFLIATWRFWVA